MALSAQELLDCDVSFNSGCSGGNPAGAYAYIMEYGITTSLSLPYRGHEQRCYRTDELQSSSSPLLRASPEWSATSPRPSTPSPVASIRKFVVLPSRNEFLLKQYVNTVGPVSVGICGTDPLFLYYGGGIFDSPDCCTDLNHAVVIVGYGTDQVSGLDYWIAQNSWGERWGENGFIRLARATNFFSLGQCGLAIGPSIPIGGHLLVPESDLSPVKEPQLWSEWLDRWESWSLSNLQVHPPSQLISLTWLCPPPPAGYPLRPLWPHTPLLGAPLLLRSGRRPHELSLRESKAATSQPHSSAE
jgi:hypothetical protein